MLAIFPAYLNAACSEETAVGSDVEELYGGPLPLSPHSLPLPLMDDELGLEVRQKLQVLLLLRGESLQNTEYK